MNSTALNDEWSKHFQSNNLMQMWDRTYIAITWNFPYHHVILSDDNEFYLEENVHSPTSKSCE